MHNYSSHIAVSCSCWICSVDLWSLIIELIVFRNDGDKQWILSGDYYDWQIYRVLLKDWLNHCIYVECVKLYF